MDGRTGSNRPMNMSVTSGGSESHPHAYMSPPPVAVTTAAGSVQPSHLYLQTNTSFTPQDILNLAAARVGQAATVTTEASHPAFAGLQPQHALQAVVQQHQQQQAAHQVAVQVAQQVHQQVQQQQQPMELDLRSQAHVQQQQQQQHTAVRSTPTPLAAHHPQMQHVQHVLQQAHQQQIPSTKINIKTESSYDINQANESDQQQQQQQQWQQQVAQLQPHPQLPQQPAMLQQHPPQAAQQPQHPTGTTTVVVTQVATDQQAAVQQQHQAQTAAAATVIQPHVPSDLEFIQAKIQDMSPVDVWNLVRMKILPYFTPWDYVCDRTRVMGSKFTINGNPGENSSSSVAKLKFLLHEMNGLAEELSLLVAGCCDTIEENVETSAAPIGQQTEQQSKEGQSESHQEEPKDLLEKPVTDEPQKPVENGMTSQDTKDSSSKDDAAQKAENVLSADAAELGNNSEVNQPKDQPVDQPVDQPAVQESKDKVTAETKENDSPNLVPVDKALKNMLGNNRLSKLKPRDLNLMAVQYQSLFEDYDGPAINIKLESESVEIECNPYSYNNSMKKRVMKIKGKEKRLRGPPYRCSICTKSFPNRNRYNYHLKKTGACPGSPVDPKPHKYVGNRYYCIHRDCLPEGQDINVDVHPQYTNRTQYWKHFAEAHGATVEQSYTCTYCSESFPLKEMHDYHIKNKHERSHTCDYCGNRFSERRTLVKHVRCHTGEKPYACDQCDFRCSSSSSLCQHKRRRHDPAETGRKHICEQCGKGFYTRDNLKEHIATHSNAKMFSCYICGKGLKNDSCYRRHMVCVHGLKHTCDLCGKDFSSPVGLKHHRRGAHGILF